MTEYWEDESDGKPRHGIGVVRHRPHRIVRHRRARTGALRHVVTIGCVMMVACAAAATLATSVSIRDTSAAARWLPEGASGPTSDPQSGEPAPPVDPATVDPAEDAERRTAVVASTERATRQRRTEPPAAPPSSAPTVAPPTVVEQPPAVEPAPSTDPTPDPTPDPCEPKESDSEQPEPGDDTGDSGEPAGDTGSDGSGVPPVDEEPSPAVSEAGG